MKSIDSNYRLKDIANKIHKTKGQAMVEYALILGGIVVAVILTVFAFGATVDNLYQLIVNIF